MKQAYSSKSAQVLSKKERDHADNMSMLRNYSEGRNIGGFAGGQPEVASTMEVVTSIVKAAATDVIAVRADLTRPEDERTLMASMIEKETTKRLTNVSDSIFKQVVSNDDMVKSAYKSLGQMEASSDYAKNDNIRRRLQKLSYKDLQTVVMEDAKVASIFASDSEMLYDLTPEQQQHVRNGLLEKYHPEAARAEQSRPGLWKAYESMMTNTAALSKRIVDPEDADRAKKMRVKTPNGRFTATGKESAFYGGTGIDGSATGFGGKSPGFNHLPGYGNS